MRGVNLTAFFALVGSSLLISCSGSAPSLDQIEWRVIYRDDGGQRYEELSLFFRISDPDGPEDPTNIEVRAGDTGLLWRFPREEWLTNPQGGKFWWGLPSMIPLTGQRLPDAIYTIRLEDLAGRYSETTFRPDPSRPAIDEMDWPEISLVDNVVRIEEPYNEAVVILRDSEYTHLKTLTVSDGMSLDLGEAEWWEAWVILADVSRGYRLGPYSLSGTNLQ
ncbi:MAG: hypothetical protein RQ801_09585 [Spirochaetaceae bacterium]|nr:hypothetical protein [Spirochaetaceae bacterium]MDT8298539.1 hypothetical protein [Spirochaetaceae bacterium]